MSQPPNNAVVKDEDEYDEYTLRCCTKEDVTDSRYHVLKFQSKAEVDIVNNFTKPVRLHRKDPKNIQFQLTRSEIDKKKREKLEQAENDIKSENMDGVEGQGEGNADNKDDKFKRKETDMSQVAPDGGARKPKKNLFKKKTRQINLMDDDKRKLRYEEYYPWVMEDYDGKNIWVGNYEAGTSDSYVLFVCDADGFKMVPADKTYKFTQRNKYATLTLEEAEAKMENKNKTVGRWVMSRMGTSAEDASNPDQRFRKSKFRTVIGGSSGHNDRDSDHDDIDFDEEFADDEEAPIMDGDEEENKLSEQRMKKEMLKASNLLENDENGDDNFDDLFDTRKVDKEGKKLRKVLNKTEGAMYDSDDDDTNPYVSQDDLEDQEESDAEVKTEVKEEETIPEIPKKSTSPKKRTLEVISVRDCMIILKGSRQFLSTFPKGDWNPNLRKRTIEQSTKANKKVKLEKSASPKLLSPAKQPKEKSPELSNTNNNLVTAEEVIQIVTESPLTTKELLHKLKGKVNSHPDNKSRIIELVKKHLKLEGGILAVKT